MRAKSVLPALTARHDVLLLAGGDAYQALAPDYPVQRIPVLRYYYGRNGKLSNYLNVKRNVSMVLDAMLHGPTFQMVEEVIADFRPDVVMTDSELYSHRAARRLRLPRMTFDHFGVLVYCRPPVAGLDRLRRWGNAFVYRRLFGEPDRVIVSSFFDAPAARSGVCIVGPAIREEVRRVEPVRGEHLLVYIAKGEHEFTPQIERALMELKCPARIYGTPRRGLQGQLQFKPLANLPFIEDLASCRAVFATTGNQLCGEVVYFGKPILGMPMVCLEQRLNAEAVVRMGIGMKVSRGRVTVDVLREFMAKADGLAAKAVRPHRDGAQEALEAIERFATELTSGRSESVDAAAG